MTRAAASCLLSAVIGLGAFASTAAAAPPNPSVQLTALACASPGNCGAVGSYDDGLSNTQGLLANEANGRWSRAVEAQPPAGAATDPFKPANGGGLIDVACPATGDCVAAGRYTDRRDVDHGVLFSESRGQWHRGMRVRLPSDAIAVPKPKSGIVDDLGLSSISCSSVGNCVAVGNYETDAEVWQALILVESHGRWGRAITAPLPAGAPVAGQDAVLLAITCAGTGVCTASGSYVDAAGHQQALLVSGSGGDWAAASAPAAPSDANIDPNIIPSSVSCVDTGNCSAAGTYVNPLQNSLGLLLTESGGAWAGATGATLPANAAPASTVGDQTVVLSSVACPQAGSCTAVGWYFDNDENGQALLVGQQNGTWQPGAEVTLPANAVTGLEKQSAGLDWISCASAGNCLATGVYTDAGYNSQGLLLSEVNGIWQTAAEAPLPSNASNIQYAATNQADCNSAGNCTVIGEYNNRQGDVLGFMLSQTGGAWARPTELALPPASASELKLSLSAILAPGGKAAKLAQIRRARHYVYDYQAIEPGTAASSWYATQAGHRVLIASGRMHIKNAGHEKLELRLTSAGTRLLASTKRISITATAHFAPRGRQRAQTANARFTLR